MKKTRLTMLCVLMALLSFSCGISEMLRQSREYNAIGGKYLLHENPRVGDFANYKLFGRFRWQGTVDADVTFEADRVVKIVKIDPVRDEIYILENEIIHNVKVHKLKSGLMSVSLRVDPLLRRIVTDREGNIKRAYSNFRMGHRFSEAPLAKPGETNFMEWHAQTQEIPIKINETTLVETTPLWSIQRAKMDAKLMHMGQSADYRTLNLHYVNKKTKFMTVMAKSTILGKTSASLSWDTMLENIVMAFSAANVFSSPSQMLKKIVEEGIESVISQGTGERQAQESSAPFTSNYTMGLNATMGYYLFGEGNSKTIWIKYHNLNEPKGFENH